MTPIVVDASIFGPLFFEDEKTAHLETLPSLLAEGRCIAPQHWRLELTNLILVGSRRKRMTSAMAETAILQIAQFAIAIDDETWRRHQTIFALANQYDLTAYDSAYLELAVRMNSALASFDKKLRRAALHEQVKVFPK